MWSLLNSLYICNGNVYLNSTNWEPQYTDTLYYVHFYNRNELEQSRNVIFFNLFTVWDDNGYRENKLDDTADGLFNYFFIALDSTFTIKTWWIALIQNRAIEQCLYCHASGEYVE